MDLVFSLTAKQEIEFDAWLVEQNKQIVETQVQNEDNSLSDTEVEILTKLLESGNPIPHHDGKYGYYSISFTPTDYGNRIYVHNHITNESFRLYDPSVDEEVELSETKILSDSSLVESFTVEDLVEMSENE